MPIVYMNSKEFLKYFIKNESDKTILDASYLLASNRIRYWREYKDQCQVMFVPSDRTIMEIHDEHDIYSGRNSDYINRYFDQLDRLKLSIALTIKTTEKEKLNVIILTTPREEKGYNHLKLIQEWVYDNFNGYKIYHYSKNDRLSNYPDNLDIIDFCNSIIKKERKKKKKKLLSNTKGQREYFSSLGKKKLKKLLKKEGIYLHGMDEAEMIDVAMTFLV